MSRGIVVRKQSLKQLVCLFSAVLFFACSESRPPKKDQSPTLSVELIESAPHSSADDLRIFKQHHHRHRLLRKNSLVQQGDVVQVAYRTHERYMTILSMDGDGMVTLHFPGTADGATAVPRHGRYTPLNNAFELDDASAFEHFFLITGPSPLPVHKLLALFQTTRPAERNARLQQLGVHISADFRLRKPLRSGESPHPRDVRLDAPPAQPQS